MLALGGGDAERLLHETVGLISVAVRLAVVGGIVTATARIWCLACASA